LSLKTTQVKMPRGEATRLALIKAAEKLIAENGSSNVTIREILEQAGQKNESALQYHFKNMQGLVAATHRFRDEQIVEVRLAYLADLAAKPQPPELRDIAYVMVAPTFGLAREHADFRRYMRAFSLQLASGEGRVLVSVRKTTGDTDAQIRSLLQRALPHLDAEGYERRLEAAIRFVSVSMHAHSQQPNAFRGKTSDLFFESLLDALVGLLGAKESPRTLELSAQVAEFQGR
jgi:AcrR family transcriptional regulator